MKRKVIYVAVVRLTDKMAADWHVDYLIENGVTVEYWDIVSLVREEHSERGARSPHWLRQFRSFSEIEAAIRIPENLAGLYVMLMTYSGRLSRIFRLLSRYDCRMLNFASGALPRDPTLKWRKIAAWLATPDRLVQEIIDRTKASALRRMNLVKPYAVTFAAGEVSRKASTHTSKVVPISFFDYDRYVELTRQCPERVVAGRYAVFLDSYFPFHSDLEFTGYRRIEPTAYFRSLNRFFGLVERFFELSVVIAAHPRADYAPDRFENRAIHRLRTAELVRDSEFVLNHTSTAMSFAVLFSKPLVFIYTAAMAEAYERWFLRQIRCFSDYLHAPAYNVDEVTDGCQITVRPVSVAHYERYKYNFLTSPASEGTPTAQIFLQEVRAQ